MNRPVVLPLLIARCPATRTVPCALADTCARALVDGAGRYSQDYSVEARGPNGKCQHYMCAGDYRPEPKAVGPKHHESIKGIS